MDQPIDHEELVEHWTLLDGERELLVGKWGHTRLGFALLLKFFQRQVYNQLNKGESLHALRRQLFFANRGQIRRRQTEDQDLQGECLTLLTNAIIRWNTVYTAAAVKHLRDRGQSIGDSQIARLSPASHEHINFYGRYDFTNPARPPDGKLRELRIG